MGAISKLSGPQRALMLVAAFFTLWLAFALMGEAILLAMRSIG